MEIALLFVIGMAALAYLQHQGQQKAILAIQSGKIEQAVKPVESQWKDELEALRRDLDDHAAFVTETMGETLRLHDEIRKLDSRARYAIRRHRERLEDFGIDFEDEPLLRSAAQELRLFDGEDGAGQPVPDVHQDMEGAPAAVADDWRQMTLKHKYGS
ncbi:MAG TPA: hypothetical protein DG761_07515 [Gammaproteobacteria bacterium]|nr:hypothetical protein [Gammaproteobacteria bacterium]|tara:strand:- start:114 stop:587 length:474 start_codon:yes stop_codon:yes gene_type:complete